jgi:hypothetical protein
MGVAASARRRYMHGIDGCGAEHALPACLQADLHVACVGTTATTQPGGDLSALPGGSGCGTPSPGPPHVPFGLRPGRALPGPAGAPRPPLTRSAPGSGYARPSGPPSAALRSGPRVPPSAPPRVLASHGGAGVAGLSGCASPIVAPVSAGARGGTSGTGALVPDAKTKSDQSADPVNKYLSFSCVRWRTICLLDGSGCGDVPIHLRRR